MDVRVAPIIEPDDVAAIVAHVEPAQQRLAQPRMSHRGTLVPERPGSGQTQADRPHLLDHLLGQWMGSAHLRTMPRHDRRAMRSLVSSFCFFNRTISTCSAGVRARRLSSILSCSSSRRCSCVSCSSTAFFEPSVVVVTEPPGRGTASGSTIVPGSDGGNARVDARGGADATSRVAEQSGTARLY